MSRSGLAIHDPKVTRKKEQMLKKLSKSIEKNRWVNQANCLHTGEQGFSLRILNAERDEVLFQCKNCDKKIWGNAIPKDSYTHSIKELVMMCDTVKMHLNVRKVKDLKIADWIGEVQYNVEHRLGKLYEAAIAKGKNKKPSANGSWYGSSISRR